MTLADVDRFAREQKRFWFAEIRRAIKIARKRGRVAGGDTLALVRRRASRLEHETSRSVRRWVEQSQRSGARAGRIARERSMNLATAIANLTRKAGRSVWGWRRPFVRSARRAERLSEQYAWYRKEWAVEREIARIVEGDDPILFGPWTSEVGYEALYWVAFTRWVKMTHRLKSERLAVMSRGGVASWYADVAPRYVEIFDSVTPEEYARRNAERLSGAGTAKQVGMTPFEAELVERARRQLGVDRLRVVHPSLMYHLFREFWAGHRTLGFVESHAKYARVDVPRQAARARGLPDDYIAVKFYAAQSLPDTPENRRMLNRIIDALSEQAPVVLLDTGLVLDEHGDYLFGHSSRVISARELLKPADNLGVQTEIIAGARGFVGTCGSLAWMAPMLGVNTLAVMTDARYLHSHLHVARWLYRTLDAGTFSPLDLGAFAQFGLDIGKQLSVGSRQ